MPSNLSLLQSARTIERVLSLDWWQAVPTNGIPLTTPVAGSTVDIAGYRLRDMELAYRDLAVAAAIEKLSKYLAQVWNADIAYPKAVGGWKAFQQAANATPNITSGVISTVLTSLPVSEGSLSITSNGFATTDDGQGKIIPTAKYLSGTINYLTGELYVKTTGLAATATVAWTYPLYLRTDSGDLNGDQDTNAPGGYSGVRFVNNSSAANGALITDRDLCRRDLILYEILCSAASLIKRVKTEDPFGSPVSVVLFPPATSGVTIDQNWSRALGSKTSKLARFGEAYNPEVFRVPDRGLAFRDNVLAKYVAELSEMLSFSETSSSVVGHLATEDNVDLTTEDNIELDPEAAVNIVTRSGFANFYEIANRLLVRISDTESAGLVLPGSDGGDTTDRIYTREPESYILVYEDSNIKRWAATPVLSGDRLSLVYDKAMRTLRWFSEDPAQVHHPQEAAKTVAGMRQSQSIEVITALPTIPDAAFYKQKCSVYRGTGFEETVTESRTFNLANDADAIDHLVPPTGENVGSLRPTFTIDGQAVFQNWTVQPLLDGGQSYYQFNVLAEFARRVRIAGSDFDQGSSTSPYPTISGTDITMALASATNMSHDDSNAPRAGWILRLPPAIYKVSFKWQDNYPGPTSGKYTVTLRWNGIPIAFQEWKSSNPSASYDSSPVNMVVTSILPKALSITIDAQESNSSNLKIKSFKIERIGAPDASSYRFDLNVLNGTSPIPIIPPQYARFTEMIDSADVFGTSWIDAAQLDGLTSVNFAVKLLDAASVPVTIKAVDLRRRYKVKAMPDGKAYTRLRTKFLDAAVAGLVTKYTSRVSSTADFRVDGAWTKASTDSWNALLEAAESRFSQAFRDGLPGDVGRPALVPDGLRLNPDSTVTGLLIASESIPTVQPFQPWMAALGIKVSDPFFWSVNRPPPTVKLVTMDIPAGTSVGQALRLDFSNPDNSEYLVL